MAANSTFTVTLRAINQIGIDIVGIRLNRVDGNCTTPRECPTVLLTSTVPTSLDSFGTPDVYRFVTTAPGPVIIDLLGVPDNLAGHVQLQLYYNDPAFVSPNARYQLLASYTP